MRSCHCEVAHILWANLKKAELRMSAVTQVPIFWGEKNKEKISERLQDQQTICLLVHLFSEGTSFNSLKQLQKCVLFIVALHSYVMLHATGVSIENVFVLVCSMFYNH